MNSSKMNLTVFCKICKCWICSLLTYHFSPALKMEKKCHTFIFVSNQEEVKQHNN